MHAMGIDICNIGIGCEFGDALADGPAGYFGHERCGNALSAKRLLDINSSRNATGDVSQPLT